MPTILEILNLSTEYLAKKEVESPRLNAELLLADVLKTNRIGLYLMFERPLQETEINVYREYLKRRGRREPLQYILGKVEFMGFEMRVNPAVLIPRPETELLVEEVIRLLQNIPNPRILDIGSGSGNISIAIAKNLESAKVTGIDKDPAAVQTAIQNAELAGVKDRVDFNLLNAEEMQGKLEEQFDIVVSNPPYVSAQDYKTIQSEVRDFEPPYAVTDYSDGYTFYRIIPPQAKKLLKRPGFIAFEAAQGQSEEVKRLLSENGYSDINIIKDLSGIERIITGALR